MSVTAPKDDRLNIRINSKLKRQVFKYCKRYDIDVSELVTRLLRRTVSIDEEVEELWEM